MRMFKAMDTDDDGLVSETEFERFFLKTEIPLGRERVRELFTIISPVEPQLRFQDFVNYFKISCTPMFHTYLLCIKSWAVLFFYTLQGINLFHEKRRPS